MQLNRDGRFRAAIVEHGVDETGPNNLATFIAKFRLTEELSGNEWVAMSIDDSNWEITGYFYLELKSGGVNEATVGKLKESLGWDGRDPMWLQDTDLTNIEVQITVEMDTYNGRTKAKVQWIDHRDSTGGGVRKADDTTRRTIASRLGSKLRAISGSPVATPKPAGKPTAPKPAATKPAKPAAQTTNAKPPVDPKQAAWDAFSKSCPGDWKVAQIEREWFNVLVRIFPDTDLETLNDAQWAKALDEAPRMLLPV